MRTREHKWIYICRHEDSHDEGRVYWCPRCGCLRDADWDYSPSRYYVVGSELSRKEEPPCEALGEVAETVR